MSIKIWSNDIANVYVWDTAVKEVYVGTTKVRPTSRLPSAYQEVEWIKSNNRCRINTWYSPSWSYLKTEIKLNFNSLSYDWDWFANTPFVFWYTSSNFCFLCRNAGNGWFEYGNGNSAQSTWFTVVEKTDYTISILASNWTQYININWNTYSSSCGSSLNTWPIPLWCREQLNGQYSYYATDLKIYYFKIYSAENVLVREFIPCYRKSDSVIWMYDLVNNQFYTNSWSWTFTKWPDVS